MDKLLTDFTKTYGPIRIRVIAGLDKADHVETEM